MHSKMPIPSLSILQRKLGYKFKNALLLTQALTHRSFVHEQPQKDIVDNERLEFFGDSVLGLVVSDYLLKKFPNFSEGKLTKLRSGLVNDSNLAKKAMNLRVGNFIRLGRGEDLTGGRKRNSILASTLEALIGAIYLDGGLDPISAILHRLFKNDIKLIISKKGERNWKELLQQHTQKKFKSRPDYKIIKETGPPHKRKFVIGVKINNKMLGSGAGDNKKQAEQKAAKSTLFKYFRKYLTEVSK